MEIDNIYNMDCLEGMKQIPDGTIDAVICDLPYGTTACAWDSVIPFDKLWEQYKRICKPNAPIVLFGSEPFSTMLRMSNFECWKYDWIWDKVSKQGILNANIRPLKQHEIVSVFCYGKPPYYPQMDKRGKVRNKTSYNNRKGDGDGCYGKFDNIKIEPNNDYYPSTILTFSNAVQLDKFHPTQMAVEELFFTKNITTGIRVAEARGVILMTGQEKGLTLAEYTPMQVKQAVVGYGAADKRQVISMVTRILSLPEPPKPDDTADALAIAICHAHSGCSRLGGYYNKMQ